LFGIKYGVCQIAYGLYAGGGALPGERLSEGVVDNQAGDVCAGMYRCHGAPSEARVDFHEQQSAGVEVVYELHGYSTA